MHLRRAVEKSYYERNRAARLSQGFVMATAFLYDNDKDRKLHCNAIHMLARELNVPEGEIQALYETLLNSLKERARIKDYLAVLVSRNVKYIIRRGISPRTS